MMQPQLILHHSVLNKSTVPFRGAAWWASLFLKWWIWVNENRRMEF